MENMPDTIGGMEGLVGPVWSIDRHGPVFRRVNASPSPFRKVVEREQSWRFVHVIQSVISMRQSA